MLLFFDVLLYDMSCVLLVRPVFQVCDGGAGLQGLPETQARRAQTVPVLPPLQATVTYINK